MFLPSVRKFKRGALAQRRLPVGRPMGAPQAAFRRSRPRARPEQAMAED